MSSGAYTNKLLRDCSNGTYTRITPSFAPPGRTVPSWVDTNCSDSKMIENHPNWNNGCDGSMVGLGNNKGLVRKSWYDVGAYQNQKGTQAYNLNLATRDQNILKTDNFQTELLYKNVDLKFS